MKKTLIEEINRQKDLIGFLTEDSAAIAAGIKTKFVEGLKSILNATKISGDVNYSSLRSVFHSLPSDLKGELTDLGIKNLDELFEDLKKTYTTGGGPNTGKKIKDDLAERIILNFEKQIFSNPKYEKLGDLLIDNYFKLKEDLSDTNKSLWKNLVNLAINGHSDKFFKLKNQLKPYFDDFYLDFAQRKLKKEIVDEIKDEPTWFEKTFKPIFDVASGAYTAAKGSFTRGYASVPGSKEELEELMVRFMTLLNSIENKRTTQGLSVNIDDEVKQLNDITYKISLLKKRNLETLWNQWRKDLPQFVQDKIKKENIDEDETFIKYVKYFESKTGNGAVYAKPKYILTRFQAFLRLTPWGSKEKMSFGQRVHRFGERLFNGLFVGDFRTWKEMEDAYEALDKNGYKRLGFIAFERVMSYFVYMPVILGAIKTAASAMEKSYGYETEPDPSDPNKVRLKVDKNGKPIPKRDIWFGDGTDFIGEKEGSKAFLDVMWMNMRRQWGLAVGGENPTTMQRISKISSMISPVGSELLYKIVTIDNVRSNIIDEENFKREQERVRRDSIARIKEEKRINDSTTNANRKKAVADSIATIERIQDSIFQKGEYEKIKQSAGADSSNF